ncbi:probable serine/threonine-protein kinase mps1 [Anopheles marshallii]|uniref:probable serine/threonine-protein kinase mps1 n=1 Tax=Anopheles marshallii TaxID=1521116 RepID=UPI00237B0ABB|nr:probable serine/threonine-protein kinase mps1 [Anopheles marshallii]
MTSTSASTAGTEGASIRLSSGRLSLKQRAPSDGTDSSSCSTREPWISTNKILNSSLCGRRINSRNPNFDYDETKLLIALWGDPVVQKTLITTHKKHPVIAELARKMRDHGYNRSTEEINTRIKNLKCFYNRIKKDMAAGIINQTTWRHYAEMDEIISRPVFGNAHRLHLQQQTKQQHQQQQDAVAQSSKHENDQDDGAKDPLPQFPVKLEVMSDDDDEYEPTEIRAEDLLTIDAKFPEDSPTVPSQRSLRRNRNGGAGSGSRAGKNVTNGRAGGNRKQTEEDDDDDEDEDEEEEEEEEDDDEGSDFDVENEFNDGLDELLQKAQATKTTSGSGGTKSTSGATGKPASTSGLVIETITSGNGTTITATGTSSTSIPTTGKISVVPTNLLMKQPSSVASSLATPIQIYTQPTMSIAKGVGTGTATMVATAGTAGTGSGSGVGTAPMKLLLVNTVAKDGTTQQILTPASEATATMPKLIPAPIHHSKIPLSVTGQSPIVTIPTVNVPKKVGEPIKLGTTGARTANGGQSAGFRTLLTQLVAIQRENLTLNKERLALEKERLEFEKQFGGSLVGMVRNMSTFFTGMLQQQRKEQQQLKETQHEPQPSNKAVESQIKRAENAKTPPLVATDGHAGLERREISSSASSPSSASRVASPTSTTKVPSADSGNETKEPITGSKRSAPSSTPPPLMPVPSSVKPSSTSDVSLPKKRRMMTRNSAQHIQSTANGTEDPLKTEVISDADDP